MELNELTNSQIEKIKGLTEDIIAKKGLKVTHPKALHIAKLSGADVDETNKIIKIPKLLLRESLVQGPFKL